VIHARLTRGVDRRRLARQAEKSAGESATLAAIAQASIVDTSYAKTPAQAEQWRQYCGEMRDAASEVNAAVHAQDVDRVSAGMKRMLLSCEACHATFRRP
jgi:cytochrome c556